MVLQYITLQYNITIQYTGLPHRTLKVLLFFRFVVAVVRKGGGGIYYRTASYRFLNSVCIKLLVEHSSICVIPEHT